jgi:hypothetical protein
MKGWMIHSLSMLQDQSHNMMIKKRVTEYAKKIFMEIYLEHWTVENIKQKK